MEGGGGGVERSKKGREQGRVRSREMCCEGENLERMRTGI